ncbi:MAG: cache domain-containing protein [Prolixibacteraceae bacterium]
MSGSILKKIVIPSNISNYLSRSLIIITVATTILIGGVLIIQQNLHFRKLNDEKSKDFLEDQKIYIQEIVQNELEYIKIQDELFKQQINDHIEQNVNQAIHTAESVYEKYYGKIPEEEIKKLIITTVSSIRFDLEYEEVFISNLDGTAVYYPHKPEFTGENMYLFKDENGAPVIQKELDLLRTTDEGFLYYQLKSQGLPENNSQQKITFVKKFGHFNWYFGCKQYTKDYFPKFQEEVARKISSVRFRFGGYIFMNQTNGTPIVLDGKVYKGNINLITNTDSARQKVFRQQLEVVKNHPEGGYFYYNWIKLDGINSSEKCSYVKQYEKYNWIIGAGFYLDEINQRIQEQRDALHKDQRRSIQTILVLLIILLFLEAFIVYYFNKQYKSDFERFFNFFYASQNSFEQLNPNEFNFDEFKRASVAANKMIVRREETEKKLIEEQKKAAEADRLKSAFLANMSHEIRTPMNAIIGFSELLEDEEQTNEDKAVFIKLISKNGQTLLNLINDIIDISKIEANLLSIRKRPVHFNQFMNEIEDHYLEILASKKDKDIQFGILNQVDPKTEITTDEIRLKQVLDNLIGNAIKFTQAGSIIVEVKMIESLLNFSIKDTGIGIPSHQQTLIFERFMQADQGQNMNFGGNGLGLAISKNLIELLGGKIHVKSESGKGSTFYFSINPN